MGGCVAVFLETSIVPNNYCMLERTMTNTMIDLGDEGRKDGHK